MTNMAVDIETEQTEVVEKEVLTAKVLFQKLKPMLAEIEALDADIKELLEEGKEADLNVSLIKAIATAHVRGTLAKVEGKAEETLELINEIV